MQLIQQNIVKTFSNRHAAASQKKAVFKIKKYGKNKTKEKQSINDAWNAYQVQGNARAL